MNDALKLNDDDSITLWNIAGDPRRWYHQRHIALIVAEALYPELSYEEVYSKIKPVFAKLKG